MEMLAKNMLVVVNPFFQKRESHKITYRSGNNRTEIDLLIVRSCQRNKVRDYKVLAGEQITSQHRPLIHERKSCKEYENWEGIRSGQTVSGNGENKQTSGNQVADETV